MRQHFETLYRLIGLISLILGLGLVLGACMKFKSSVGLGLVGAGPILFMMLSGVVITTISAVIFAPIISEKLAWSFQRFLFPIPEVKQVASLGIAQALVMKRDYDGALRELESKMEQYPDQKNLLPLYYQIKYEKYEQSMDVLKAIREEIFNHRWDPEYEKLVSIAIDIYLENLDVEGSQAFLKLALEHCDEQGASARMSMRLHSFQDFQRT